MRPVRTPYRPVGRALDYRFRDRLHEFIAPVFGDTIGSAELKVAVTASQKIEQRGKILGSQAVFFQHVTHVINHKIDLQRSEKMDQVAHHIARAHKIADANPVDPHVRPFP